MNRLIGLTGKSGAGKGVVCDAFRKRGIPCIDADRVYHEMLLEDNACTKKLIATFGSGIAADDRNGQATAREGNAASQTHDSAGVLCFLHDLAGEIGRQRDVCSVSSNSTRHFIILLRVVIPPILQTGREWTFRSAE